jgi:hypothetical protein
VLGRVAATTIHLRFVVHRTYNTATVSIRFSLWSRGARSSSNRLFGSPSRQRVEQFDEARQNYCFFETESANSWFFLSFPATFSRGWRFSKRRRTQRGNVLRLIQNPFSGVEFGKNPACLSSQFAAKASCRFKFLKGGQLFLRSHHETLSVTAMRVCNEDCSPVAIQ